MRNELYYAVAGRHLQGGYVEFPPVTALFSAAARVLSGWSLIGFRSFAVLAGAATIVLAALVARELGGGRGAQVIAAVAFSPRLLAANGLFQPVSFDLAATMLVLWLALRLALGRGYALLGRIDMPTANQERGLPIASCTLDSNLAAEWPQILRATGP